MSITVEDVLVEMTAMDIRRSAIVPGDYVVAPRSEFDRSLRGSVLATERFAIRDIRRALPLIEHCPIASEYCESQYAYELWDVRHRIALRRQYPEAWDNHDIDDLTPAMDHYRRTA